MVHHLKQDVENVRVRLLDLIEEQHRIRLLGDRFRETRRCTDKARYGVPLHVFGHVETVQFDAHAIRKLARDFGFSDTRWTREKKCPDRLLRIGEARTRSADRRYQGLDGLILAEHDGLQVAVEVLEGGAVVLRHRGRGDARNLGDDFLDLGFADDLLLLGLGQDLLRGACLIDDIDRLVGQMPVVDVAGRQFGGAGEGVAAVLDAVVCLETRFQAAQDRDGLFDRRLGHVDFLEAPRQRMILFEHAAVLVVSRRADAFQRTRRKRRLQQVRCVERPS